MAYHLRRRESVPAGVRRIAVEEITAAIQDVQLARLPVHEAVHELRKRCKKLRGLLRLVRPELDAGVFDRENAFFRDLAREFSFIRDANAHLEALERLIAHSVQQTTLGDVHQVHGQLLGTRQQIAGGEAELTERLAALVEPLEQALDRASGWTIANDGFEALAAGLKLTYQRARGAMRIAYRLPSTHNFHQWRKRVKYHWYHALLLERICPRLVKPHARLADDLGELLGQDHDYAGLRERLTDLSGDESLDQEKMRLITLIDARQAELRVQMARLGHFLQAEKPRRLVARWRAYWDSSHQC
jgi:hypothetical protein